MQIRTSMNEVLFESKERTIITIHTSKSKNVTIASNIKTLLMYHSGLIIVKEQWIWGSGIIVDFVSDENDQKILLENPKIITSLIENEAWLKDNYKSEKDLKMYKRELKRIQSLESTDQLSLRDVMMQKDLNEKILTHFAIEKILKAGRKHENS